jgi:hypothetical protein
MVVIQMQIGKNIIDVLLDGGLRINIIIEQLNTRLGLLEPKPTPYNLRMVNQNITKPIGLTKDLKMYVHGISYIVTFTIL